jgi:hypothetical protein
MSFDFNFYLKNEPRGFSSDSTQVSVWSMVSGYTRVLEKFEDSKEVIRGPKSKKDRQYNAQKKKDRQIENIPETIVWFENVERFRSKFWHKSPLKFIKKCPKGSSGAILPICLFRMEFKTSFFR